MPVTYQELVKGASWVVMGPDATAFPFDARWDTDGSIWVFQQVGNGWAHYSAAGVLIAQGNFFGNVTAPAVMQHDEGIMLWAQDNAGHYFVRDTTTLYKLDSTMATVATLALSGFSPTGVDTSIQTFTTEDMVCVNSGGVNYIVFCSKAIISPDTRNSAILFVVNADTMAVVGTYVDRPGTANNISWTVFGDKNGDIWMVVENDTTSGVDLVQWHPANGATGGTLNSVSVHSISTAVIGFSLGTFLGGYYDATNHCVILTSIGGTNTSNLTVVDMTTFTQVAKRTDDGSVSDNNFVDGTLSANHSPGNKCQLGTTGDDPANNFQYNGAVLKLLDPHTLVVSNTFDIAAGINAGAGTHYNLSSPPTYNAYPGAWLYNAGLGTMLAGFSNLGASGAVYLVSGLPVFSSCSPAPPVPCGYRTVAGTWQDAAGNALAGGKLTFRLMADMTVCTNVQIVAGRLVTITLDNTGSIPANTNIAANTQGATYDVRAYNARGLQVWRNPKFTLPAGAGTFSFNS